MSSFKNLVFVIAIISYTALPRPADSATVLALSLEDLTERSDIIVRGTAIGVQTHRGQKGEIVRSVFYHIDEYLIGEGRQEITIRLQGGELDGVGRLVPGEAHLTIGEDTVLFLKKKRGQTGIYRIVGLSQGKFDVVKDSRDGDLYASRSAIDINMVGKPIKDSYSLAQNERPFYMKLREFVDAVKAFASN